MDRPQLLTAAEGLLKRITTMVPSSEHVPAAGAAAEVSEFFRLYAGPKSAFYAQSKELIGGSKYQLLQLITLVSSFIKFAEAGLHEEISPERRAQLDVVSDILDQANTLLGTAGIHPAAPAILIGATLEEFLRTWIETVPIAIGNRKPGMQAYADCLREADLISKQDLKDVTAWAGVRNSAAHGDWESVSDPRRIRLMLEGVNLFMRKYGA